jgi:predicted ArsR family transcriptional regulator
VSDVEAIAALGEPVRRRLYDYVVAQDHDVGRAEAADAAGVGKTLAAFHLDRLAEAGLLDVVFRRPPGKAGPGAGRPAKLYRRSGQDLAVSLPPRDYVTPAALLAEVVEALGAEAGLEEAARRYGRTTGASAKAKDEDKAEGAAGTGTEGRVEGAAGTGTEGRVEGAAENGAEDTVEHEGEDGIQDGIEEILARQGYAPYREGGAIRMRNCPFHALARDFPPLTCGMNLALVEGLLEGMGETGLTALLRPRPGECCVEIASKNNEY